MPNKSNTINRLKINKMKQIYKILHTPTGLYFEPGTDFDKTNLTKNGKIYSRRPEKPYYGRLEVISRHNDFETGYTWFNHKVEKDQDNWEVKTFKRV